MYKLIFLMLLSSNVLAQECVLQSKIVNNTKTLITEVGEIRRDIVPWANGQKKCLVNFKAQIDGQWHMAHGEYVWDGERPAQEACGAAVTQAKKDLTQQVKPATIISEEVLICNDDTKQNTIKITKVGSIVDVSQLRAHPNYPNRFVYNGTECKWFLDSSWTGKDIREYQGIVCKVEPTKWVVVDKF
jgi:hypothetical protein